MAARFFGSGVPLARRRRSRPARYGQARGFPPPRSTTALRPMPHRRTHQRNDFAGALMRDNPNYLVGRERMYEGMRMAGVPEG